MYFHLFVLLESSLTISYNFLFFGFAFLPKIYSTAQGDVTVADVTSLFKTKYPSTDLEDVFGEDSDYDVGRMLAQDFVEKAGITSLPQVLKQTYPLFSFVLFYHFYILLFDISFLSFVLFCHHIYSHFILFSGLSSFLPCCLLHYPVVINLVNISQLSLDFLFIYFFYLSFFFPYFFLIYVTFLPVSFSAFFPTFLVLMPSHFTFFSSPFAFSASFAFLFSIYLFHVTFPSCSLLLYPSLLNLISLAFLPSSALLFAISHPSLLFTRH